MWKCTKCNFSLTVDMAPPNIDDQGIFFTCPLLMIAHMEPFRDRHKGATR